MKHLPATKPGAARGFTLLETLVVLGIMGLFLAVSIPSVLNTMAVRNLENKAHEVQTYLQMTKLQAVNTKIVHRVRFYQTTGTFWDYEMERLQPDGTWVRVGGAPPKNIPTTFNVTFSLPLDGAEYVAIFTPLGTMGNFVTGQNSIVIQSPKLAHSNQEDERVISIFLGGSIQYAKRKSS